MALKTLDELNRDFMYDRLLNVELKRDDMSDWHMDIDEESLISAATQKLNSVFQTFRSFAGLASSTGK